MSLEQISMRVDSRLLKELDQIAKAEFKRRSDVVRDALVTYVKREIEIRQIKEMVTKQFLEGELGFDDFARIVGFEVAQQIKIGKETLKESIERAKKDSKQSS
jgi:predicted transcriptional regulator